MTERNENIEHKLNSNGTLNPKYIDLLDEDKAISGQKFACISFLSPENIIKRKELYDFNEFVKQWEMIKAFEKYTQFLNFISYVPAGILVSLLLLCFLYSSSKVYARKFTPFVTSSNKPLVESDSLLNLNTCSFISML